MITTQTAALAGMQIPVAFAKQVSGTAIAGNPTSFYPIAGSPLAGLYPNTGLTGGVYSSSSGTPQGFLNRSDPPSGNAYLGRLVAAAVQPCTLLLCDRLWDCQPTINVATPLTITSPTLPNRDALGQANGLGVQMGIEIAAAASSTAAVIAMSYTNSAGASGKSGTFIDLPTGVGAVLGRFYRINLQAGDQGVQSVQTVTFSTAWTTGTIALVAYRVLAKLDLQLASVPNMLDVISGGFPRIYNGSCLFFIMIPSATTTSAISGNYTETQG